MLDQNRPTIRHAYSVHSRHDWCRICKAPATAHTDSVTWDDDNGETFEQALVRFETFGPQLTATDLAALDPRSEVWAFGYGDDPVDFDGVEVATLLEAIAEDGAEAVDRYWGPFAAVDYERGWN